MAFPQIVTYNTGTILSDTAHEVSLPGSIVQGNLLIVFFSCNGDKIDISISHLSGLNWHEINYGDSSENCASAYYKVAQGGDVLHLITSEETISSYISYQISGASSSEPLSEYYADVCSNADPPSLTPTKGAQDYLWLVYAGIENTVVASAAPYLFSGLLTIASESNGSSSSSAYREYNTASAYNPARFTSTSAYWVTFTVCIRPAAIDGFGIGNIGYYKYGL